MREPNFRSASSLPSEQADLRRQQEVGRAIQTSVPSWIADGRMVPGELTDADEASVSHGLRRGLKGWVLVSPRGTADRVSVVETFSDGSVVKLKNVGATGTLTFRLWVF